MDKNLATADLPLYSTVSELVREFLAPEEQQIKWNWGNWGRESASWSQSWSSVLADLRSDDTSDGQVILRSDLAHWARADIQHLFLAAMVWGFGEDNFGPWRTGEMLKTDDALENLADIVNAVRNDGPAAGFTKLWDSPPNWPILGKPRIHWLNVSFGTKLLFVVGIQTDKSPQPLVYDAMVGKALRNLTTRPDKLPRTQRGLEAEEYEAYCDWAGHTAIDCQVKPENVEYALFQWGKELRRREKRRL